MMKLTAESLKNLAETAQKAAAKTNAVEKQAKARRQKRLDKKQQDWEENPNDKSVEPKYQAPVRRLLELWSAEFSAKFPDLPSAKYVHGEKGVAKSFGKERGQAQDLFRRFEEVDVLRAAKYLIQNWEALKARFFKGSATHPTLGMLKTFDAQIVPEAKEMGSAFEAKAAYDKWCSENSNPFAMPDTIRDGYEKAKKALSAIGVK